MHANASTSRSLVTTGAALLLGMCLGAAVQAAQQDSDWPTHRGDLRRSGTGDRVIDPAALVPAWTWRSDTPVRSAWPSPARWDAYAALSGMKSMRNYDPVIHVTTVHDRLGEGIFLSGPTDDTVRRLDAVDGRELWRFTADGPVRIAPTWHKGRLYFGSDDGHAYAIDAINGRLLWKRAAVEDARRILNNTRFISPWPVRTGVHVMDDVAYFAASFLPWEPTMICAVDARTGASTGERHYIRDLGTGWTMEGPLLLSEESIIVPQGRVPPLVLDRANGAPRGALSGGGGSFVLLTDEEDILHGPGNKAGWITDSDGGSREKIASYQRGNAMIVEGETAWMLSDRTLSALDRPSGTLLWSASSTTPLELIKSGPVLIAGGEDQVAAYEATTGNRIWDAPVDGNAYGLVVAGDRLIVSTDEGAIHVFRVGTPAERNAASITPESTNLARPEQQVPVPEVVADGLVDRWVFREDLVDRVPISDDDPRLYPVIRNEVEGRPPGRFRAFNEYVDTPLGRFVEIDGGSNDLECTAPGSEPALPTEAFTLLAVVRIDEARNWGGLLCALQDNGTDETGWILGYRGLRPGLGLRGSAPDESMSWILDSEPVVPGSWHVIAARYDGNEASVLVDGKVVARSTVEQGPVIMPDRFWYGLGSYHDDDEYFVTSGSLAELRVHDRPLTDAEIRTITDQWAPLLALPPIEPDTSEEAGREPTAGPILAFETPGVVRMTWRTQAPTATRAVWTLGEDEVGRFVDGTPTREHEVLVDGLRRNRIHEVRVGLGDEPEAYSRPYPLDTSFDYTRHPVAPGVEHDVALGALLRSGIDRGLAIVIGAGDHDLPLTLARNSRCNVLVIDENQTRVEGLRKRLLDEGCHGERISALVVEDLTETRLPPQCANLVVVGDGRRVEADVLHALLTPEHGVAYDGRTLVRAPSMPGTGVWTHMYGTPDNSGYGGETLGGITDNQRLALQWIGRPGPRYQSDRGNRKPSPLAAGGRLYMQGLNRIICVDDHNGTILWSKELPEMQRFNIPRDTSNWCADATRVFVAGPRLLVIDGATGEIVRKQAVPELTSRRADHEWGYVARTDDALVGSAVRTGSSHTGWWGAEHWYDGRDNFSILKVCSDALFVTEPDSGSLRWEYQPDGVILNPSITTSDGNVVFLEAGDPGLVEAESRKIEDDRIWKDLELVALDEVSGEVLWRREASPMPGNIAVYTAVSDGILYLQTSSDGAFALYAFDLNDGRSLWRRRFDWEVDHHGKHLSRLAIAEGVLYLRPYVLDARTGEVMRTAFPEGHQCGNYACTSDSIFLRAGDLTMWSPREDAVSRWQRVRPDCWISTVPANGMVLSPEGGGGCSCGSWIESSMAFRPELRGRPGEALRPRAAEEPSR